MKHVTRLAAIVAATVLSGIVCPGAAHAIIPDTPPPPGTPCDPNDWPGTERRHTWVDSAETDIVLTHFLAINVAPGTTGSRTDTLTTVNVVTTTFGTSTEISEEATFVFAKVSLKVGFSLQQVTSSTNTASSAMTWSFGQPGYYGLYKGTRRVVGTVTTMVCFPPIGPITSWQWVALRGRTNLPYTTYSNMEEGTITCDPTMVPPPGSLRELARRQLGC
jgi:hypothetical protein